MSLFFFLPCFCKIARQLCWRITLPIHRVLHNRGNRKLLLKPAYLLLLFLIRIKRYSTGTRWGVGRLRQGSRGKQSGQYGESLSGTVVSYVVMEWRQLSPRMPPSPPSSAVALPRAQLFPATHTHAYRRGCKRSYLSVSGRRREAITQLMKTVTASVTASHSVGTPARRTVRQRWLRNRHILIHLREEMVVKFFFQPYPWNLWWMLCNDSPWFRVSELGSKFGHRRNPINHWVILLHGHITHGWFVQLALCGARGDQSPRLIFHCCLPGDVHLEFQSYSPGRRLSRKGGFFFPLPL